MYDSWAMYDALAAPTTLEPAYRQPTSAHNDENKAAAVSQAAYQMLIHFFPEYETKTGAFSRLLTQLRYEGISAVDNAIATKEATPSQLGFLAAQAILVDHGNDGTNAQNDYADMTSDTYPSLYVPINSADPNASSAPGQPDFDLNHWQPLRVPTGKLLIDGNPAYDNDDLGSYVDQAFLTPHWGAVRTFAMTSGTQFRPPAPPQAGSDEPYTDALGQTMTHDEAYHAQVDEVLELSANLTNYQKVVAEFWADGPRSETPPGHWNQLAQGIAERDRHSLDQDVKLFFALTSAIFDAGIAGWEAKRAYDYIRPVSAIHHKYYDQEIQAWGGPNQGTQTILGQEWRPYQALNFVTPPFAEYISGHSIFSAAAAEVLTSFTGSNRFYDNETMTNGDYNHDGIPDMLGEFIAPVGSNNFEQSPSEIVVLRWPTFQDAAVEAGISRLYGGIHIQDGNLHGQTMGTSIGSQAYDLAQTYWTGRISNSPIDLMLMGDVDCNGTYNATDGLLIMQYDINLVDIVGECSSNARAVYMPACDVDGDGRCNATDALLILRCDVGYHNVLCPEN